VFGVNQIADFYRKTGKTTFTLEEFMNVLGVKETSAKRYLHEASRLGVVFPSGEGYVIDEARLTIIYEAVWGLKDTDSLLRFLKALEKKGLIKGVGYRTEERGSLSSDVFKAIVGEELDPKALSKLEAALSDPSSKVLCTVAPSYLTTDLLLLIKNRLNLPATSFIELSQKVAVVTFERERQPSE